VRGAEGFLATRQDRLGGQLAALTGVRWRLVAWWGLVQRLRMSASCVPAGKPPPRSPVRPTPPGPAMATNIEVMQHAGLFGRRSSDVDALFERPEGAGTTRRSPFT
jgi:hypothetical protein